MVKVKSITSEMVNTSIEEASEEDWYLHSYHDYDVDGNLLTEIEYLENGEIENKVTYKYNKKGRVLEHANYSSMEDITEKFIYDRDENDNITEVRIEYLDGSKSFRKYDRNQTDNTEIVTIIGEDEEFEGKEFRKFNNNRDKLEEVIYNDDSEILQKFIFEYDEEFNLINQKEFGEEGLFLLEIRNKYNDKGKLIEEERFNQNKEITRKSVFVYNKDNEVEEINIIDKEYYPQGYLIKFEEDKEKEIKIEERYFNNGELDYQSISKFDKNNLITENSRFSQQRIGSDLRIRGDKFNTVTRYKYEFY